MVYNGTDQNLAHLKPWEASLNTFNILWDIFCILTSSLNPHQPQIHNLYIAIFLLLNVQILLHVKSIWPPPGPPIWALRLDSGLRAVGQNICTAMMGQIYRGAVNIWFHSLGLDENSPVYTLNVGRIEIAEVGDNSDVVHLR